MKCHLLLIIVCVACTHPTSLKKEKQTTVLDDSLKNTINFDGDNFIVSPSSSSTSPSETQPLPLSKHSLTTLTPHNLKISACNGDLNARKNATTGTCTCNNNFTRDPSPSGSSLCISCHSLDIYSLGDNNGNCICYPDYHLDPSTNTCQPCRYFDLNSQPSKGSCICLPSLIRDPTTSKCQPCSLYDPNTIFDGDTSCKCKPMHFNLTGKCLTCEQLVPKSYWTTEGCACKNGETHYQGACVPCNTLYKNSVGNMNSNCRCADGYKNTTLGCMKCVDMDPYLVPDGKGGCKCKAGFIMNLEIELCEKDCSKAKTGVEGLVSNRCGDGCVCPKGHLLNNGTKRCEVPVVCDGEGQIVGAGNVCECLKDLKFDEGGKCVYDCALSPLQNSIPNPTNTGCICPAPTINVSNTCSPCLFTHIFNPQFLTCDLNCDYQSTSIHNMVYNRTIRTCTCAPGYYYLPYTQFCQPDCPPGYKDPLLNGTCLVDCQTTYPNSIFKNEGSTEGGGCVCKEGFHWGPWKEACYEGCEDIVNTELNEAKDQCVCLSGLERGETTGELRCEKNCSGMEGRVLDESGTECVCEDEEMIVRDGKCQYLCPLLPERDARFTKQEECVCKEEEMVDFWVLCNEEGCGCDEIRY